MTYLSIYGNQFSINLDKIKDKIEVIKIKHNADHHWLLSSTIVGTLLLERNNIQLS